MARVFARDERTAKDSLNNFAGDRMRSTPSTSRADDRSLIVSDFGERPLDAVL
jgi:hypothetical protein